MALTEDVIKQNADLKALTPEQIAAVVTLSKNDEEAVIPVKIGEMHGLYEKDILETSGVKKIDGEKSHVYMKRVISDLKTKAESAGEVTALKATIKDLEKKIADGNTDPVLKQKLADTEGQLAAVQKQYDTDKDNWAKEKNELSSKVTSIQVSNQFDKASSALKFKPEYSASVQAVLLNSAKANITTKYKPDWVGEGDAKVMVFRGQDGEIARNPENKMMPFTAQELLATELKDALDAGKPGAGAGTGPAGKGAGQTVTLVDLAGAKTQKEADDIIFNHLMSKGFVRGSAAFAEEQKKIRLENKVAELPIK